MGLDFRLPWKPFGRLRRSLLRRPLTGGTPALLSALPGLFAAMPIPVKAWRTVDAGPSLSLYQMIQTPFELALAQSAAHPDKGLALVSADAFVGRLCDRPDGVREAVATVNPAPATGSARAPLRGPLLLPGERVLARHATSSSVANQVHRRSPSVLPGTVCRRLGKPRVNGSWSLKDHGK